MRKMQCRMSVLYGAVLLAILLSLLNLNPYYTLFTNRIFLQKAKAFPSTWPLTLDALTSEIRATTPMQNIRTVRVGCREYESGAQSCVFRGLSCVNVSSELRQKRPKFYLIDDENMDGEKVPAHRWCSYRYRSSDPRYFGSRHWPIPNDTVAPQWSCFDAQYRSYGSVFGPTQNLSRVKLVENLWLVDLDYASNDHNNHYLKDLIWILDVALWQQSLSIVKYPGTRNERHGNIILDNLFDEKERKVLMPQSQAEFLVQTNRDVNRLNFAIIFGRDPLRLFPNYNVEDLHTRGKEQRRAVELFDAYPELIEEERLLFYKDYANDSGVDLICSPRLTVGSKLGNLGHERVCREIKERSWKVFGIAPPPMRDTGYLRFPQPPKRLIVLQRHISRKFENLGELASALRKALEKPFGIEVEINSTAFLKSAEDNVRFFSRAGVLLTPHGSQAMGQIYMPRHSAIIEVMPPGYTHYAFNLMAETCKNWYYELQGVVRPNRTEFYREKCGHKMNRMYDLCVQTKNQNIIVDVEQAVKTVKNAFVRLGYEMLENT